MADGKHGFLPRGPAGAWRALVWSLKGIAITWRTESSFRLEVYLFFVIAPLGLWLGRSGVERAVLFGCLLPVMSVECVNSAIETLIERYGAEQHELAGRAKDMGSAAVFVLMMNALACWALVLIPRWLAH